MPRRWALALPARSKHHSVYAGWEAEDTLTNIAAAPEPLAPEAVLAAALDLTDALELDPEEIIP